MTHRKSKIIKISALILMLLSLFLSIKYYKVSDEFDNYIVTSELENKILDSQLTEILHKYDSISFKNRVDSIRYNDEIKLANSKFSSFEDSIERYVKQKQSFDIKKGLVKSDEKTTIKNDKLIALNINAKGVKIYSDNYNSNDSKIQQLRVCFTLEENNLIASGEKIIYIQVVNPKNQIISSGNTSVESVKNVKLQYSASVNANYKKYDTDVCTYVNLEQKKTIKGKYTINIYHDFAKIGTSFFEY
jgi:hypothetical protein